MSASSSLSRDPGLTGYLNQLKCWKIHIMGHGAMMGLAGILKYIKYLENILMKVVEKIN